MAATFEVSRKLLTVTDYAGISAELRAAVLAQPRCYRVEDEKRSGAGVYLLVASFSSPADAQAALRALTPSPAAPALADPAGGIKQRRLVEVGRDAPAALTSGARFTGYGRAFRIRDEDACVYGLEPGAGLVRYAYYV